MQYNNESYSKTLATALDRYDHTRSILESTLPFEHQVAGHTKELLCEYNGCILKPLVKPQLFMRELTLYEELSKLKEEDLFMFPKYYGAVEARTETNATVQYIVLTNLSKYCKMPCVIDIKIGKYTYEPSVDETKKEREKQKYIYQEEIGFRITGCKVYNSESKEYTITDKHFGRSLLPTQVLDGLSLFFYNSKTLRCDVLAVVLCKLRKILEWMLVQCSYQFYCSSILIIYDGDVNSDIDKTVEVKMIDLAHTITVDGILDDGYIHGLQNLIGYLDTLSSTCCASECAMVAQYERCQALLSLPGMNDFVAKLPSTTTCSTGTPSSAVPR